MVKSFIFQMIKKISRISGTTQREFCDRISRYFSIGKILEVLFVFLFEKGMMIEVRHFSIECIYIFSFFRFFLSIVSLKLDTCFFCEDRNCLPKLYFLHFHKKSDWTTSLSTRKTVSNIFLRGNDKRRSTFAMKRTKSLIVYSCLF